jgi:hypothetical protein
MCKAFKTTDLLERLLQVQLYAADIYLFGIRTRGVQTQEEKRPLEIRSEGL